MLKTTQNFKPSHYLIIAALLLSQNSAAGTIESKGYFKDGSRNRIFTVQISGHYTKQDALDYARTMPNTTRQITAVYFYPEGSLIPNDGITLAKSIFKANYVLYDMPGLSKWRYAYMRYLTGTDTIVDCKQNPTEDLCRR